jgi:alpha-L-arabinofuranosidase
MNETTITFHTAFQIGEVDPRIFGGFLEHMGRAVYEGVYEPDSVHADANGWRGDVLAALEGLRYPVMRYPGGNFASGYHWLDGVGPRAERPVMRELAWQSTEINQVGTDEFVQLCRSIYYPLAMMSQRRNGVSLQMAVNGPRYTGATHGEVAFIDGSGIWDGRSLHVLLTNRHQTDTAPVQIHLADGTISGLESAELLTGPDAQAANSYEEPHLIRAQAFAEAGVRNGRAAFELPPLSVFAATFLIND